MIDNQENTKNNEYSASNIQILTDLDVIRLRPALYIGDVCSVGLHNLAFAVIENSIDEAMAGHCTHIDVSINEDGSVTVSDDGRGIPVDYHETGKKSALEVVLTTLHAGGKFNRDAYKISGGLHGVGLACVNALSSYLKAEIHRNGKIYVQEYSFGKPQTEVKETGVSDKTGTTITFLPDRTIFNQTVEYYNFDIFENRLRELAFLNKGIRLSLTDKRALEETNQDPEHKKDRIDFYSQNGLTDFIQYLDACRVKMTENIIYFEEEKDGIFIEIAMRYNTGFSENIYSFVNNINTVEGGVHLSGFRRGLTNTLRDYAEKLGALHSRVNFDMDHDDFREGLTAVISVKVAEPHFSGQTKSKLGNSENYVEQKAIREAVSNYLEKYLEENPRDAKAIVGKIMMAGRARYAARKAREKEQREGRTRIYKWEDNQITMTTVADYVEFHIAGDYATIMTIDWGDGTKPETHKLKPFDESYLNKKFIITKKYAAEAKRTITITGKSIIYFDCRKNKLTELDVSKAPSLIILDCRINQLTALDVSANTALESLGCVSNKLTALNVSQNTELITLFCFQNRLTALDVSQNTALEQLWCFNNPLTQLDISGNTALTQLGCWQNQLTELDVSRNTALKVLLCYDNQLTALDVSQNIALECLDCFGNEFTADAINSMFETLHDNAIECEEAECKKVIVFANPGENDCDKSIAERKGWKVNH